MTRRTLRLFWAILLTVAILPAAARAAAPGVALSGAREGATVRLAPGVWLTAHRIDRRGGVVRVADGRLRLGRVATGRRVRAVVRDGQVKLTGGRFKVADGLTDRQYTISSARPLVVATGTDGAPQVSGSLSSLPGSGQAARAAAVGESDVEHALPAPVGSGQWRVGLGLNAEGIVVRLFLNDTQAGSGLVRYTGSYRLSLAVRDLPALGARISVAGDVAGSDITRPAPITGLRGTIDGKMQLADRLSVGDGSVSWDSDGVKLDAGARLECQEGALDARVTGVYRDPDAWSFAANGGTTSDGCAVADGASITDAAIGGEVTNTGGEVTGAITAQTPDGTEFAAGTDAALIGPSLGWSGGGLRLSAGLRFGCPAGGAATATVNVVLPHGAGLRDWSVGVGAKVGSSGCGVVDGLRFGPDTALTATVDSVMGRIGVAVDATATVRTSLIPTKDTFHVSFALRSRGRDWSARVSGTALGASFGGTVNRDGTFTIDFDLSGLEFAGAAVPGAGRILKQTPDGAIDTQFRADVDAAIALLSNISIRGGSISYSRGQFVFAGTLRLRCSRGYADFTVTAAIKDLNDFSIGVLGVASTCTLGKWASFDGQTLKGQITFAKGKVGVDISGKVGRIDVPQVIRDKNLGELDLGLDDTYVHMTNTCADGCGGTKLRVELEAKLRLGWRSYPFAGSGVLTADVLVRLDLFGPSSTVISISITNTNASGLIGGIDLEGLIRRALGDGFTIRIGPEPLVRESSGIGDGPLGDPTTRGTIRSLAVRVRGRRPTVTVRVSQATPVTVEIQRRGCGSCAWQLVQYRVVTAKTSRVARWRAERLRAGRYRTVARLGSAGSGRPVARPFRVA